MASSVSSPVGEWDVCGDRFYAKHELYNMQWADVSLDQLRVACARYGGPIAVVRDDRKIVLVTGGVTKPVVKTFTAAGAALGAFLWDGGRIAAMGWTDEEDLMILVETGEVLLYSMHGQKLPRQFSLGPEVAQDGILRACLWGAGLVVLTGALQLWAVIGLQDVRPQRLADPNLTEPPVDMAVIQPEHTLSGSVEVLIAADDAVIVADPDSAHRQPLSGGALVRLAVAPNGQFLAAFTSDGRLLVWTADLTKNLSEFATQSDAPPLQLAWCGTDSVVMYWEDILLMVGPYGDWVKYTVEEPALLAPELDGVRVLTASTHELLRRIPDALADVYRIGSTTPGALLYDARDMFDKQNAKADEVLRSIVNSLPEAVATCAAAAAAELDPLRQNSLLKAACYGRAFCPAGTLPKDLLLTTCRKLRVLNALRAPDVGVPLTLAELEALTMPVLVSRLVNARRHLLALRITQMLGMGPERVLVHWACAKINASSDVPDDRVRDELTAKLAGCPGIRYASIASHAQAIGRRTLAALLLDYETCAAEQVPLLLSLGEEQRALVKALESGDTDLVYLALFRMYRSLPLGEFLAALNARPQARALFTAYCARKEPELLEQIYTAMGVFEGVAEMRLQEAIRKTTARVAARAGAGARLGEAAGLEIVRLLDRAADSYAQTKEHGFQSRSTAEFAKLRKFQLDLEEQTGNACFLGLSLADTLRQCVRLGNHRAANRARQEFKISDRRFWWLKIRTLAASKDWEGLEEFAREKKPPVGFEPFIAACRAEAAPEHVTARFIARLPDGPKKAEEYAAVGLFREAAEAAARARDSDMLTKIQGMVGTSSPLGVAVTQIKDRLQSSLR